MLALMGCRGLMVLAVRRDLRAPPDHADSSVQLGLRVFAGRLEP